MANQYTSNSNSKSSSSSSKSPSSNRTGTQGGTPEQHRQAGMQSHKNSASKNDAE